MRRTFRDETFTADTRVGSLTPEWAERLGLEAGIAVGTGVIDCHAGAVGAGINDNEMVKVVGTSTCDIIVAPYDSVKNKAVRGICGQVDGSVIPGRLGFEAGQAAFGDVYAWFRRLLLWPLENIRLSLSPFLRSTIESGLLIELSSQAEKLPLTEDDPVATDWFNGRRTPDLDPLRKASLTGLSLGTTAPCPLPQASR